MATSTSLHLNPKICAPSHSLSPPERETAAAVLEDCVNQLSVIGGIMPKYTEKPSTLDPVSARAVRVAT